MSITLTFICQSHATSVRADMNAQRFSFRRACARRARKLSIAQSARYVARRSIL
jgi:hypothetical protein